MDYIVLDFEFNSDFKINDVTKKFEKIKRNLIMPQEIIEIGAVRLKDNYKTIDSFQTLIRPKLYKKLNPILKRMTKISNEDLNGTLGFKKCIKQFKEWIGTDDYVFCTWGNDDIFVLICNCIFNNVNYNFIEKYVDLQYIHSIKNENDIQVSLEDAVKHYNIKINSKFHRALNDAIYASKVMKKLSKNEINKQIVYLR